MLAWCREAAEVGACCWVDDSVEFDPSITRDLVEVMRDLEMAVDSGDIWALAAFSDELGHRELVTV